MERIKPEQKIVRNSIFGVSSQVFGGGIMFLVTLLSARYLGPEHFGIFSFSFAIVAVVHMFAGGLTNILVREISRDLGRLEYILGATVPLVTLLSALAWLGTFLAVSFSSADAETSRAIYILTTAFPVTFNSAVYAAVCRAKEEMIFNAIALISQRLVLLLAVLVTIFTDFGLLGIAISYLIAHVFQWLYFSSLVSRRYCRYRPRYDLPFWRHLVVEGIPVALSMVMQRIAWYADIFMLTLLSTTSSVGLYGAAFRLIEMLSIIPTALSHPIYPSLSRLAADSNSQAFPLYLNAQKFLVIIGLPLGFWIFITAPQLMAVLFGPDYVQATPALRILGVMLVMLFLNSLYLHLFSAMGEQRLFMILMSLIVALNVMLDLVLIPVFDFSGAASATLISEFVLYLVGNFLLVRRGLQIGKLLRFWKVIPALLAAALILVWPVNSPSIHSLIFGTVFFGLVYFAIIYKFDLIAKSEFQLLWSVRPRRFTNEGHQASKP